MYNPNSVIIQSMMGQQGGVQPCYTPPVPIGNITNITGAAGYNGGYYNGMYNNYYNPYMVAQQRQAQEAQERELRRQQSSAMKMLSRAAHAVDGSEITDEQLDELYDYHPVEEMSQEDKDWIEINKLAQQPPIDRSIYIQRQMAEAYSRANKFTRPDMTLEEFLEAGWDIMADIMTREQQEKEKDLSTLYNKTSYSDLVNKSAGFHGNVFKKEVTIDDMSVFPTLSHKTKMEYAERRQRFMDAILHGNK